MPDDIAVTRHTGRIMIQQDEVAIWLSLAQAEDLVPTLNREVLLLRADQASWMLIYGPTPHAAHLVPRAAYDEHGPAVCGQPAPYTQHNGKGWWSKPLTDSPRWHRMCHVCLTHWEQTQDAGTRRED